MIHPTENNSTTCDNTKRGTRQTTSADGENEQYCSTSAAATSSG